MHKVNIAITFYNHEKFIQECIDSVLKQVTNFSYKLTIIEDCSMDNSREVLRELKSQYPDDLDIKFNKKNLGVHANWIHFIEENDAEYLAFLDGDDYWTDELKLQKEIDLLDSHPSYSMCTTAGEQKFEDSSIGGYIFRPPGRNKKYLLEDILQDNYILTSSVVARSKFLSKPQDYLKYPWVDWPLWVELAMQGPIGYIDDVTTVYRKHTTNLYGTLDRLETNLKAIAARKLMLKNIEERYHRYCYHSILNYQKKLLYVHRDNEDAAQVHLYARKCLNYLHHYQHNSVMQYIELKYYSFYSPRIHKIIYPILRFLKSTFNNQEKTKN